MVIKEAGVKVFVFQFEDFVEKDMVLVRQPWSFNKSVIVLNEFDGLFSLDDVNMKWYPFWIQIHGLPLGLMNKNIEIILG